MKKKSIGTRLVLGVLLLLLGIACLPKEKPSDRDFRMSSMASVEKRVHEYMSFRQANDLRNLYKMTTPDFRSKVPFDDYKESPGINTNNLISYYIEGIEMETKTHAVAWTTEYTKIPAVPGYILLKDIRLEWIQIENEWYFVFSPDTPVMSEDVPLDRTVCGGSAP